MFEVIYEDEEEIGFLIFEEDIIGFWFMGFYNLLVVCG